MKKLPTGDRMKLAGILIILLKAIFLYLPYGASLADVGVNEVVVLDDEVSAVHLYNSMEFYIDEAGIKTIDEISSAGFQHNFKGRGLSSSVFRKSHDVIWAKVIIDNQIKEVQRYFFYPHYQLYKLNFYLPQPGGNYSKINTGRFYKEETQSLYEKYNVVSADIPTGKNTIYFRFEHPFESVDVDVVITGIAGVIDSVYLNAFELASYLAIGFFTFVFNLIAFFTIRDKSYLYYALTILTLSLLAAHGHGVIFWWNRNIDFSLINVTALFFANLSTIFSSLFFLAFLQVKKRSLRTYQFIVGCIWINFVNIFLSFLGWRYSYELMVTILLFVAIVPLWFSSKRALVDPFSAFYTVAWGIHLTVVTLYVLTSLEVMNTGVYHSQVMLGSIIEMFVMTFALGYRFFLINRDKNLIEKKVDEEIKRSASWEEISYTDALTGIYNRRKFDEYISMYTTIAQRNNQPFYLILLDIDHFKKINDTYGHDIGDQVLVDFSKMVTQLIRKSDIFCRYGGEEFALIVSNNESLDGPVLAEKIRQNMESNEFSEKAIKLTISCGVASFEANDTVSTLIRCADEALYKAKRAGRNRVEVNPPIECDEQRFPT